MEQKLHDLLIKIGLLNEDIEFLRTLCPGIDYVSYERASKNLASVINAGYPQTDIDSLIAVNPNFLLNDPEVTRQKLANLDDKVEELLKDNPELI